jgi:hypothetical protein
MIPIVIALHNRDCGRLQAGNLMSSCLAIKRFLPNLLCPSRPLMDNSKHLARAVQGFYKRVQCIPAVLEVCVYVWKEVRGEGVRVSRL